MSRPTPAQQQLKDPAWWDENAPEGAEYVAIAPDNTLIFYRQDSIHTWQIWAARCQDWMLDGFARDAGGPPYELIPRPAEPAAPELDGEGLPPVGTTNEISDLFIDCIHPAPTEWEIIAHRGDEAVLYQPQSGDEQAEVYLLPAHEFKNSQTEREREEVITNALRVVPMNVSDEVHPRQYLMDSLHDLYDAGMLRKGDS